MEIERKYLIHKLPENLDTYPYKKIEQAYLCTEPVVRIRKQDEEYFLTYKGKGLLVREEYNLPLTEIAYLHLKEKADGIVLSKTRYLLPLSELFYQKHAICFLFLIHSLLNLMFLMPLMKTCGLQK